MGGSFAMFRKWSLKDVQPENQGGSYRREFDSIFWDVANAEDVPFALLKAHAIVESSLRPNAIRDENPTKNPRRIGWTSFGLMQLLWWPGTERFSQFGYPASSLGDGTILYQPNVNIKIAARLIKANLQACNGNLRDAINMYNAGVKESVRPAPLNYVDKVIGHYETLIKGKV